MVELYDFDKLPVHESTSLLTSRFVIQADHSVAEANYKTVISTCQGCGTYTAIVNVSDAIVPRQICWSSKRNPSRNSPELLTDLALRRTESCDEEVCRLWILEEMMTKLCDDSHEISGPPIDHRVFHTQRPHVFCSTVQVAPKVLGCAGEMPEILHSQKLLLFGLIQPIAEMECF